MRSTRSISKDQTQKLVKLNEQRTYQEEIYEEEGIELRQRSLRQAKFFLEYTQDKGIKYIMDGIVLRDEKQVENSTHSEFMKNLEQAKYLRWEGEFGKNHKKLENGMLFGEDLIQMQVDIMIKMGKSKENGSSYFLILMIYVKQLFKGSISRVQNKENERITLKINKSNGVYNESGQKNGSWIDLHDQYSKENLITFEGKYQNGLKLDKWNAYFQIDFSDEKQRIGGGIYSQNGLKSGSWIDIQQNYYSEVIYLGEYLDGKKQGKWSVQFKENDSVQAFQTIGGGLYDLNEQKTGKWIELYENFGDDGQILFEGEYFKGIKQGNGILNLDQMRNINLKRRGGKYDLEGKKIGKWIDLKDNFWSQSQVIEVGEYQNGKRKGQWALKYRYKITQSFIKMQSVILNIYGGSGIYDDFEKKNGKWVEIFQNFQNLCQVVLVGQYLEGRKVGKWDRLFRQHEKERFQSIAGGVYDEKGGIKNGKWIHLIENFRCTNQVIIRGDYLFGKKSGQWDILYKKNYKSDFQIIGGGQYNQNGEKDGNWIELNYSFGNDIGESLFINTGSYKNGLRTKEFKEKLFSIT